MAKNCEVCKLLNDNSSTILVTDYWRIALADDQGYLGRTFVTLKKHKQHLSDLNSSEWQDFIQIVNRIESSYKKSFGAINFNWVCLMNNAYQEPVAEPHVHWHVRPRYNKPVILYSDKFIDPNFGHHYDRNQKNIVNVKTFNQILSTIKANF